MGWIGGSEDAARLFALIAVHTLTAARGFFAPIAAHTLFALIAARGFFGFGENFALLFVLIVSADTGLG